MKFKFDLDLTEEDLAQPIEKAVKLATAATAAEAALRAEAEAARRLKSGLKHWKEGFHVEKVSDGEWIIGIDGLLAEWMEDGIKPGEISEKLLDSPKVKSGKNGKYIDVPIPLNADMVTQNVGYKKGQKPNQVKARVQMSSFRDANQLVQSVGQGRGKGRLTRIQRAADGIIKKVEQARSADDVTKTTNVSFLAIRRVSEKSTWPSGQFPGAKVLELIDAQLDTLFLRNLRKFLERM